jgi:hypothetical protein
MKTFFSEYQYARSLRGVASVPLPQEISKMIIETAERQSVGIVDEILKGCVAAAQWVMLAGKGTDYFITTPELADLISAMVKDFTADVLDIFQELRNSAIVIHPVSPRPAVLLGIRTFNEHTIAVFHERGGDHGLVTAIGSKAFVEGQRMQPQGYADRLAIGLALYVRFFPAAVHDGLPEIAKHPAHYKGQKCASIGMAEELIDRRGAKPHIRQAHFRFLSSEKFTKKRNTYVLVRSAFIRGKCKIVVEVEGTDGPDQG